MTEVQKQLVTDNIKLVYHLVWKLGNTEFVSRNRDDLTSEGTMGLIKAAAAFDPSKGIRLATFASRCIMNEMLMFIRRNKKYEGDISLFTSIGGDDEGRELTLVDILCEKESNIEQAEKAAYATDVLKNLTSRLDERENQIVEHTKAEMTQKSIAKELGISQSYVSRLLRKIRSKSKKIIERDNCG